MEAVQTISLMLPSFLRRLAEIEIKSVVIAGCGGGFDFVHSANIYPELRRLNKQVIIVSYSFGHVGSITGNAQAVWNEGPIVVKEVSAASKPDPNYGPEVHMVSFLDSKYPQSAPHKMDACNAREFTVPSLHRFYSFVIKKHNVDAFIIFDGGSDSLMRGDEEGLGDPIEDCVSVTAVSLLEGLKAKILISAGFGADRFNHVSDASSLRAVAELTQLGGFMGSISLEPNSEGFQFYCDCVKHIYDRQDFRSVLTGLIISSGKGYFGFDLPKSGNKKDVAGDVDVGLQTRVRGNTAFVWPLMSILFAFNVDVVCQRSYIASWIKEEKTVDGCYKALQMGRHKLAQENKLRVVENLPKHQDMASN